MMTGKIMKSALICSLLFLFALMPLCAVEETVDFYSMGFNDAYSTMMYNSKYDLKKLNRKLRRRMTRKTLSAQDLLFLEQATEYNEGFLNGLAEKYRIDTDPSKASTEPFSDMEDLTYTQISIPLSEEPENKEK